MTTDRELAKAAQNAHELKMLQDELLWKNIHKFANKWNMGVCMVAIPECAFSELRHEFDLRYPTENFDLAWNECVQA